VTQPQISQDDLDALAAALDGLALTTGQRALLSAIVSFAATASAAELAGHPAQSFREQFAASFTPHQASLLVSHTTPGNIHR